ncbi:MupA/Atu3671 family FMN-dependent luciferase-like monooxygenase [Streptomyces sp. NPDC056337]|uniref:MupA/Atu3671 family FMN-dependent luciferase-like monooxygenase n=1 Tax=Streptomyces sp. NPDC056337 TaxID=3345787 RepID=UPI0035D8855C
MFFGADAAGTTADHTTKYEDILAIARAADTLGFDAVWTPERHFQEVGQVFPSPPVLSAALAMATERIALRGGSVVLPLHHPLRVVEDWAVVDNLSHGRAGFSVATGWHSADFVLAPDRYVDRREHALRELSLLRALWKGESGEFLDGTGRTLAVRPHPHPVQDELPLWLTTSGSPATWKTAGDLRTGVLAATMGQSRADLAAKIAMYREAYTAPSATAPTSAHGARGTVTLMVHAYVGMDDSAVRRRIEAPLKDYLSSYVRQTAANRGGQATAALDAIQVEQLTEFALRRYLSWGSLLGSQETCARGLRDLKDLGCDEIACFIDFGLTRDEVMDSLHRLAALRKDLA